MILYGDLDVSILDEQPPGRQPVDTFLVSEALRPRIHAFLRKQVEAGHQCFVVCPAVEERDVYKRQGQGLCAPGQAGLALEKRREKFKKVLAF